MNNYIVKETDVNKRLDMFLSSFLSISRNKIQSLIKSKHILVNNKNITSSYKLKLNDIISYQIEEEKQGFIPNSDIKIDIVYEDDDIVIINKPQGLVVHPSIGHHQDTLVNGLKYVFDDKLSDINGEYRLGIVHRIDKDTSGLLCIAKNNKAHLFLQDQLKDHTMKREYIALVEGNILEDEAIIDIPIGRDKNNPLKMSATKLGKKAYTKIKILHRYEDYTLIKCALKTGRTHQIRVHLSYINHPVVGDKLYNKSPNKLYDKGQLLHAYKLELIHPTTKKLMSFEVPLPDYFNQVLSSLK